MRTTRRRKVLLLGSVVLVALIAIQIARRGDRPYFDIWPTPLSQKVGRHEPVKLQLETSEEVKRLTAPQNWEINVDKQFTAIEAAARATSATGSNSGHVQ